MWNKVAEVVRRLTCGADLKYFGYVKKQQRKEAISCRVGREGGQRSENFTSRAKKVLTSSIDIDVKRPSS